MGRYAIWLVAALAGSSLAREAIAGGSCSMAALRYYCTAATMALAKATPDEALARGLHLKASEHGMAAERLGHADLKDRYYARGIAAAAEGRRVTLDYIIAQCIEAREDAVQAFITRAEAECRTRKH